MREPLCSQLCEVCIDVFFLYQSIASPSWLLLPDAVAKATCQSLSSRPACFPRVVLVGYINILMMKKHAGGNSEKDHGVTDDIGETDLSC